MPPAVYYMKVNLTVQTGPNWNGKAFKTCVLDDLAARMKVIILYGAVSFDYVG